MTQLSEISEGVNRKCQLGDPAPPPADTALISVCLRFQNGTAIRNNVAKDASLFYNVSIYLFVSHDYNNNASATDNDFALIMLSCLDHPKLTASRTAFPL